MIKDVEFPSEGATLRGLLFLPESKTRRLPLVIMAHGTSATAIMVVDKYAEAFSRAGLAVLLYNHRNFGKSEGEPRQEINPWIQCRGYLDAVKFTEKLDGVDPERIALWGDSYTGSQVIVVGAIRPRVKAIVAQVPVFGAESPEIDPNKANFDLINETLLRDDVRRSPKITNSKRRFERQRIFLRPTVPNLWQRFTSKRRRCVHTASRFIETQNQS